MVCVECIGQADLPKDMREVVLRHNRKYRERSDVSIVVSAHLEYWKQYILDIQRGVEPLKYCAD